MKGPPRVLLWRLGRVVEQGGCVVFRWLPCQSLGRLRRLRYTRRDPLRPPRKLVDREKVAYATFDGVDVLVGFERADCSGVIADRDPLLGKSVVQIFDAEYQGRARIERKFPVDAASGRPAVQCSATRRVRQ